MLTGKEKAELIPNSKPRAVQNQDVCLNFLPPLIFSSQIPKECLTVCIWLSHRSPTAFLKQFLSNNNKDENNLMWSIKDFNN